MADIRSETAKIYQSADDSEDLLSLVASNEHGHTIHEFSDELPPGSPIGAVFVRIDENRLLKVRIPIDQGFISSTEPLPELPPLPELGNLPLPPPAGDLPYLLHFPVLSWTPCEKKSTSDFLNHRIEKDGAYGAI